MIFKLRSYQKTSTRDEVLNDVFSLLESTAAMSWSLTNALEQSGHEVPLKSTDATYMNLSPLRLTMLALKERGMNILNVEESETSWKFLVPTDSAEIFELALAISVGAPEAVTEVSVSTPNAVTPLRIPLSAYGSVCSVEPAESPSTELMFAMLELRNACSIDGHPILNAKDLKFVVAAAGIYFLEHQDSSQIPYLRRALELAKFLGRQEIVDVVKQIFSQNRTPDPTTIHRLNTRFKEWLEKYTSPSMPRSDAVIVYKVGHSAAVGVPDNVSSEVSAR